MPIVRFQPYTPLPEDTYLSKIVDCTIQENRVNQQQFYSWTMEITDEQSEFFGQQYRLATPLTFGPGAAAYKFFVAAGMPEQDEAVEFDTSDFIGAELYVKLKIVKSKDGRESNKPEAYTSLAEMDVLIQKAANRVRPAAVSRVETATHPTGSGGTVRPGATVTTAARVTGGQSSSPRAGGTRPVRAGTAVHRATSVRPIPEDGSIPSTTDDTTADATNTDLDFPD